MVSEEERSYAAHNATHHGLSCGAHPLARDLAQGQPYHTCSHSPSLTPSLAIVTTVGGSRGSRESGWLHQLALSASPKATTVIGPSLPRPSP